MNIKTAYRYDENTKEYLGTVLVQTNPENSKEYLMPNNTTLVAPPETEEGKIACFENEEWIIKTDYRGHYQVNLEDITFSRVDYIGDAAQGYQFIADGIYEDYMKDNRKYKIVDGEFTDISETEEYQEILRQEELYRISQLQCTKRVFVEIIEKAFNLDYFDDIEPLINENKQAKKEWTLCVELKRDNPLLDDMAAKLDITSEQLDLVFRYANGEISPEELIPNQNEQLPPVLDEAENNQQNQNEENEQEGSEGEQVTEEQNDENSEEESEG